MSHILYGYNDHEDNFTKRGIVRWKTTNIRAVLRPTRKFLGIGAHALARRTCLLVARPPTSFGLRTVRVVVGGLVAVAATVLCFVSSAKMKSFHALAALNSPALNSYAGDFADIIAEERRHVQKAKRWSASSLPTVAAIEARARSCTTMRSL